MKMSEQVSHGVNEILKEKKKVKKRKKEWQRLANSILISEYELLIGS